MLPPPASIRPWTWDELFPDADHQFSFQFKQGALVDFYRAGADASTTLAERASLLAERSNECVGWLPSASAAINETQQLFADLNFLPPPGLDEPQQSLAILGRRLEPDLVWLQTGGGPPTVVAGVVCFPTGWSLPDKLGRPLLEVHEIVPGMNNQLGDRISKFLVGLKPGISWERINWGLAATPQRNLNPATDYERLTAATPLDQIHLRIETQSLTLLPRAQTILFGIRIHLIPLIHLWADDDLRPRIQRALRTMPTALAAYKGLVDIRDALTTS